MEQVRSTRSFDPFALYAGGIDTSDYVAAVAPLVRRLVPSTGDLLDLGAGGGQMGGALREPGRAWTAVEPAGSMRARLADLSGVTILPVGWDEAELPAHGFDTVLAANMPGPLADPERFLRKCLSWTRRDVVWIVPAQNGPRGLCLAGCLPSEWHGEDETPGLEVVLEKLDPGSRPREILQAEWTFSLQVEDVPALAGYLADRLGWPAHDARRRPMTERLLRKAKRELGRFRLDVARASAVLVWRVS